MSIINTKMTVLFEPPFWVGILERVYSKNYEICRVVFGAEPKDCEVYEFFVKNYNKLRFSPRFKTKAVSDRKINPKRLQRKIQTSLQNTGMGTKAQQALKLCRESAKKERKAHAKEDKLMRDELRYKMHRLKKKQKHKGH